MFYTYFQNNSKGFLDFFFDEGITDCVIIEASDHVTANKKAEKIGLYFDGCEKGIDCYCCGDRWVRAEEEEGKDFPYVYDDLVSEYVKYHDDEICIHYENGSMEWINVRNR